MRIHNFLIPLKINPQAVFPSNGCHRCFSLSFHWDKDYESRNTSTWKMGINIRQRKGYCPHTRRKSLLGM
jgi:hypothetical protein